MSGMCLTPDQEESLLKKYDRVVQRIAYQTQVVANQMDKCTREDLLQEGRIVLLKHIRSIDNESEVYLCTNNIRRAMFIYLRHMAVVHIPVRKYSQEVRKYTYADNVDVERIRSGFNENFMAFHMMNKDFLAGLSEADRIAFEMKLDGYTQREIMNRLKLRNDSHVSRKIKKLRDLYWEFCNAGEAAYKTA